MNKYKKDEKKSFILCVEIRVLFREKRKYVFGKFHFRCARERGV